MSRICLISVQLDSDYTVSQLADESCLLSHYFLLVLLKILICCRFAIVVGKGGFGKVNAVTHRITGKLMAMKRMKKAKLGKLLRRCCFRFDVTDCEL